MRHFKRRGKRPVDGNHLLTTDGPMDTDKEVDLFNRRWREWAKIFNRETRELDRSSAKSAAE